MAAERKPAEPSKSRRSPATTPEAREYQLIDMAVDLAERQIRDGTASSQVITHFLKLGTTRERLEQEKLRNENLLIEAKVQAIAQAGVVEELYRSALSAMRTYGGEPEPEDYDGY